MKNMNEFNRSTANSRVGADEQCAPDLAALEPVARAIDYLVAAMATASDRTPDDEHIAGPGAHAGITLETMARGVDLSPGYFQKIFKAGAGISPKRFQQYLASGRAKHALMAGDTVFEASLAAGLSGPSRLHDLMVTTDAMTPGTYRQKGAGETIRYGVVPSPFGAAFIGATQKGICWLSFDTGDRFAASEQEMRTDWPAAAFQRDDETVNRLAAPALACALRGAPGMARLHLSGSNFQLKVWDALLRIPVGRCVTYGDLATAIGKPGAARAVGAAVGANNISVLIPCHRVILASGAIHNYRWGAPRKRVLLALEAARTNHA